MATTTTGPLPMNVDEGPPPQPTPLQSQAIMMIPHAVTHEEEARQAIDMLRGQDVSHRVAAAHRIDAVAVALGSERTRDELLPFVTDGVDDEDEVLLGLAKALGRMIEAVGGPTYAHHLLRPLELLLMVEESAVREAATESALLVAEILPDATFNDDYGQMLKRLTTKEWFTARISAASLLPLAYLRLEERQEPLELFATLCKDDVPMVRRVAAQYLGEMVQHVVEAQGRKSLKADGAVVTILMPLYDELASNEQPDSVRLQTTGNCVAFGKVMSDLSKLGQLETAELELLRRILPLIVATTDDRSWRVRWTAAAKFADVIAAYDVLPDAVDSLVPAYEKLLSDPEAEVRTAATFNLAQVARCSALVSIPPLSQSRQPQDGMETGDNPNPGPRGSVAERLVKRVTSLTEDDSEHVRAALAMVATGLAPILGRDLTISHLVPPVLLLLRDAASEVRLNLISSLSALNEVIGVDLLSQSLLPAILDLAQDGKWRIRRCIIQHIPLLAEQLGQEFFTDKLSSLCVGWLGDDIASIRSAAADNLKDLTALFGTNWAIANLLPSIVEIRENDSYLRRLTALKACSMMAIEMDTDSARLQILPLVLEMATDVVPNIRFNVAKELQAIASVCGVAAYETQVLPVLTMLMDDDDRDVRFYAEKTANLLDEEFANKEA